MTIPLHVVNWAAEECNRQESGEMSVYNMCIAWNAISKCSVYDGFCLSEGVIKILAEMVEPEKNKNGYRNVPVFIRDQIQPLIHYSLVPRQIKLLVNQISDYVTFRDGAVTWYEAFQKIHPFTDGNGRVGSILYNYLNSTLDNPVAPPNVFN